MTLNSLLHLLLHVIFMFYQVSSFSLKMIPIDSPQLQILPKHFTIKERHHFLRDISMSRAFNANKKNANLGLDSIHSNLSSVHSSYYVTQLTVGTINPPFSPIVILDIVSDQTWIQCSKCNPCFNLTNSFHDKNSSTYEGMDLNDKKCSPKINYEGSCGFEASFGKGHTRGYMGKDTLFFDGVGYFDKIAFGCAINSTGFTFGTDPGNVIAGVLGLATMGPKSFMEQLSQEIKGVFTYCIRRDNVSSTMVFGDDAKIIGDSSEKVQTIYMEPDARYNLKLADITVEGTSLNLDPSLFELDGQDYTKGFFIDPSSPFTILTYTAYKELKNAIIKHFTGDGYKWEPLPTNNGTIFDLCYSDVPKESKGQGYPTVIFNFLEKAQDSARVDLKFDPRNIFGKHNNGFCMEILPTPDAKDGPSIFGAYQQANIQFLYNVNNQALSFVSKTC